MTDGQKLPVAVRFTQSMAAAARRLAERDGKTVSEWMRHIVEREIARREGKCPTCGQETTATLPNRHTEG